MISQPQFQLSPFNQKHFSISFPSMSFKIFLPIDLASTIFTEGEAWTPATTFKSCESCRKGCSDSMYRTIFSTSTRSLDSLKDITSTWFSMVSPARQLYSLSLIASILSNFSSNAGNLGLDTSISLIRWNVSYIYWQKCVCSSDSSKKV